MHSVWIGRTCISMLFNHLAWLESRFPKSLGIKHGSTILAPPKLFLLMAQCSIVFPIQIPSTSRDLLLQQESEHILWYKKWHSPQSLYLDSNPSNRFSRGNWRSYLQFMKNKNNAAKRRSSPEMERILRSLEKKSI